jgi:hypothetical protein
MHPVDTLRSLVTELEDVRVLLPHPAIGDYRCVVVVADDKIIGEATAVEAPSGFGEGLLCLFRGQFSPLSSPSLPERKRNSLTLLEKSNGPKGATRVHTLDYSYPKCLSKFPRRPLLGNRVNGGSSAPVHFYHQIQVCQVTSLRTSYADAKTLTPLTPL